MGLGRNSVQRGLDLLGPTASAARGKKRTDGAALHVIGTAPAKGYGASSPVGSSSIQRRAAVFQLQPFKHNARGLLQCQWRLRPRVYSPEGLRTAAACEGRWGRRGRRRRLRFWAQIRRRGSRGDVGFKISSLGLLLLLLLLASLARLLLRLVAAKAATGLLVLPQLLFLLLSSSTPTSLSSLFSLFPLLFLSGSTG